MSEDALSRRRALERDVAALFEATGHQVDEAVGDEPGTVVRMAVPEKGFVRPRTFWEVWLERPEPIEPALTALDAARARYGADRALGIVVDGCLPEDFREHAEGRDSSAPRVIALRRLVFELTGIVDELRERATLPEDDPAHPKQFVQRHAVTEDGQTVDAVEYVEDWIQNGRDRFFVVEGPELAGKKTLIEHLAYRNARQWIQEPSRVVPLVEYPQALTDVSSRLIDARSEVALYWAFDSYSPNFANLHGHRMLLQSRMKHAVRWGMDEALKEARTMTVALPASDTIRSWYRAHLTARQYEAMASALSKHNEFEFLATSPEHLSRVLAAVGSVAEVSERTTDTWLAEVMVSLLESLVQGFERVRIGSDEGLRSALETGSLEQFALGESRRLGELVRDHDSGRIAAQRRGAVGPRLGERVTLIRGWLEALDHVPKRPRRRNDEARFSNPLVRDYFLARKIASEVREGRTEILTRYQFPQHFVLLYLAVIAPDVIAQVTADRSAELRAQVASDMEHELQLTLSHQLRRVVGALHFNLERVRKALPEDVVTAHEYEWRRVDKELEFLHQLAERTRRWHQVPDTPSQLLRVADAVHRVAEQLHADYQRAELRIDVPDDMTVSASPELLRGALHYLLENAFQAVVVPGGPVEPRVDVHALYQGTGETIRIEIRDNGSGVAAGDHERIFEPRVTTKKGGEGVPLGTGMGLPIARRYAERMGGRVALDASAAQTCFFVELVARRPEGEYRDTKRTRPRGGGQ